MKSKRVALLGLFIAIAMMLSYVEAILPLSFAVPGIKLGLANLVTVFVLYRLGMTDAAVVSLARVSLTALLFGSALSLMYSVAGAALSFAVMALCKRGGRFSVAGVSVAGGVAHNVGQLAVAAYVLGSSKIFWYFPVLCVSGVVAGCGIGLLGSLLLKRLDRVS